MKIEKMTNVTLTDDDIYNLNSVNDLLNEIQKSFTDNDEFYSPKTGECFSVNELGRIRGIIDGLVRNEKWIVK